MISKTLKIEGHRGYLTKAPENSLESFLIAKEEGIDGIETDLWLTKDNVIMISHGHNEQGLEMMWDPEANKMVPIIINKETHSRISKLRFTDKQTPMPTLRQLFEKLGYQDSLYFNLEFKDSNPRIVEETVRLIMEMEVTAKIHFCGFNNQYVDTLKDVCFRLQSPQFRFFINIAEFKFIHDAEFLDDLIKKKADVAVGLDVLLSEKELLKVFFTKIKAVGGRVSVYNLMCLTQFEGEEVYEMLIECGVDIFCCNDPDQLKEYNKNMMLQGKKNSIELNSC